jgi:hypothetical protein
MKDAKDKRMVAEETKDRNAKVNMKLLSAKVKTNKRQVKPKIVKDPNQT